MNSAKKSKFNLGKYINTCVEYRCNCKTGTRVYLGFIWGKYFVVPIFTILYGLVIYSLFSESHYENVAPFVVIFIMLPMIEYWRYNSRKKKLLNSGHKPACAKKAARRAFIYDIPRVESFDIVKVRKRT